MQDYFKITSYVSGDFQWSCLIRYNNDDDDDDNDDDYCDN